MSFRHTPFYCEENVYHLADHPTLRDRSRRVVFISNPFAAVALWHQRAAHTPGAAVLWDYHVILVTRAEGEAAQVWDLDTTLPLPSPLAGYLRQTFLPLPEGAEHLAPRFRVLEAEAYREAFSSDRSHMRGEDGRWTQPPPPWPAITRSGAPSFLRWTEMEAGDDSVDRGGLRARLM